MDHSSQEQQATPVLTGDLESLVSALVEREVSRRLGLHYARVLRVVPRSSKPFGDSGLIDVEASDVGNFNCEVEQLVDGRVLAEVPIASPHLGQVAPPDVGAIVILGFIGGHDGHPVVLGSVFSDALRPELYGPGSAVTQVPSGAIYKGNVAASVRERFQAAELDEKTGKAVAGSMRSWSVSLPTAKSETATAKTKANTDHAEITLSETQSETDGQCFFQVSLKRGEGEGATYSEFRMGGDGSITMKQKLAGQAEEGSIEFAEGNITLRGKKVTIEATDAIELCAPWESS